MLTVVRNKRHHATPMSSPNLNSCNKKRRKKKGKAGKTLKSYKHLSEAEQMKIVTDPHCYIQVQNYIMSCPMTLAELRNCLNPVLFKIFSCCYFEYKGYVYESRTFGDPTDTPAIERPAPLSILETFSTVSDSVSNSDSKVEEGFTVASTMEKLFLIPHLRASSSISSNLGFASNNERSSIERGLTVASPVEKLVPVSSLGAFSNFANSDSTLNSERSRVKGDLTFAPTVDNLVPVPSPGASFLTIPASDVAADSERSHVEEGFTAAPTMKKPVPVPNPGTSSTISNSGSISSCETTQSAKRQKVDSSEILYSKESTEKFNLSPDTVTELDIEFESKLQYAVWVKRALGQHIVHIEPKHRYKSMLRVSEALKINKHTWNRWFGRLK